MGRLKTGAVEKVVCEGHERLKVPGKVSSKFLIIGYIPIVSTPFFFFFLLNHSCS